MLKIEIPLHHNFEEEKVKHRTDRASTGLLLFDHAQLEQNEALFNNLQFDAPLCKLSSYFS